jgi:predicted glycoside hydrolase/deacetylase ChbG (UPF0249 family)
VHEPISWVRYTERLRRLIINADDFGLTPGVNRAIAESHQRGIVTSATLMANAAAFNGAAVLARSFGNDGSFSTGCHVVLLDGEPVLPAERVTSLLQAGTSHFRNALGDFVAASFRRKLKASEIEAEAGAQMERLRAAGVEPSHFDTHKHAHIFPAVLRPLLRTARAHGIMAVRNPFGQVWPLPFVDIVRTRKLWTRFAQLNLLRKLASTFRREVHKHGVRTTDGSLGVLVTGVLDLELFSRIVDNMPEGTWEFVCHPGYNDADLDKVRTRLRESRARELELLTSPEARKLLQRRGIQLINYREL